MQQPVSYRDILRHHANGLSQRKISKACGCARSTVQEVVSLAKERDVGWEDVAALSEPAARELIRGRPDRLEWFAQPDFEAVHREMSSDRTMTLSLLWEEYLVETRRAGGRPYMYSRFCELYNAWCDTQGVDMSRIYVAGDYGEFDWAGQTMEVACPYTGEVTTAYLFVACLPFSQMTFVRAYPRLDEEAWIEACMEAFEFYGGCPRIVVTDNLATGVTKHTREEIVLNRTFREFAEHYNVAVIPHWKGEPTGKASVESSVGKIANKIRNMLRKRAFFSFEELNSEISERLADLNSRPFQKRKNSREVEFRDKEEAALLPLPAARYEVASWSPEVTVPRNFHVMCAADHVYYSLPCRYVGRRACVRTTRTSVEIFCEGERVATHVRDRSKQRGERVTDIAHRPQSHRDLIEHDSAWFRARAAEVGPACSAVIEGFLSEGIAEEQGWGWCEKLLRKLGKHPPATVEEVCASVIAVVPAPSYKTVNTVFKNHVGKAPAPKAAPDDDPWAIRRYS